MISGQETLESDDITRRDHCFIYIAKLQTILFAVKQAYQSQEIILMIFSDSLSALQALEKN